MDDAPRICGQATGDGKPCSAPPWSAGSNACHQHLGLPATQAQKEAARSNGSRGICASGFRHDGEREVHDAVLTGQSSRSGREPLDCSPGSSRPGHSTTRPARASSHW